MKEYDPGNSAADLFGMVKWPLSMAKWPPTRGSKGHFESPGHNRLTHQKKALDLLYSDLCWSYVDPPPLNYSNVGVYIYTETHVCIYICIMYIDYHDYSR